MPCKHFVVVSFCCLFGPESITFIPCTTFYFQSLISSSNTCSAYYEFYSLQAKVLCSVQGPRILLAYWWLLIPSSCTTKQTTSPGYTKTYVFVGAAGRSQWPSISQYAGMMQ